MSVFLLLQCFLKWNVESIWNIDKSQRTCWMKPVVQSTTEWPKFFVFSWVSWSARCIVGTLAIIGMSWKVQTFVGCLESIVTGILTNQIPILFFFPFLFFLKGVVGRKKLVLAASPCAHVTLDKLCCCLLCLFSLKWFRCPEISPT